jgi:hypothetical protein
MNALGLEYLDRGAADANEHASFVTQSPLETVADRVATFRRTNGNITIPSEMMRIQAGNGSAAALVQLTVTAGMKHADGPRITSLAGKLFLRLTQ